jgi:very-short-patch-repair endonuclease
VRVEAPVADQAWRGIELARKLRRQSTEAENFLWRRLRARQAEGAKFRRQYALGAYFLDFYCTELRLAIEVDGGQHFSEPGASQDEERSQYLESIGVKVLRFTNHEVFTETEAVLTRIWSEVGARGGRRPSP